MGDQWQKLLTATTASNDASVKISAHETVLGQAFSTAALIWSITSKPLNDLLF
jgi:hypothetical protein